jgi:hypothetical protein
MNERAVRGIMQIKDDVMNKRSLWLARGQRNFGRALPVRTIAQVTDLTFNSAQL